MAEIDRERYELYRITFTATLFVLPFMFLQYTLLAIVMFAIYTGVLFIKDTYVTGKIDCQGRGVFITGCDTGFGHAFAKHFHERGFTVFAGCLDVNGDGARKLLIECPQRLHVVELDVTSDEKIANAFAYVKRNKPLKGLWGIVNNAGINMKGEIELCPVSYFNKGVNVNLYGAIRIIKAFLPILRQSKGRIVNITSVHGYIGMPNLSNYQTAKHGIETLSDSLRMEMKKFGVKVCVVAPSMFGHLTSVNSALMVERQNVCIENAWESLPDVLKKTYTRRYLEAMLPKPTTLNDNRKGSVQPVIHAVEQGLCSENPRTRYLIHGYGNIRFIDQYAILGMLYRILPTWIIDKYVVAWTGYNKLIN